MPRTRITQDLWLQQVKAIHGDRYDYSDTVYVGYGKPVTIRCPLHGPFSQRENNHRVGKHGCPTCGVKSRAASRAYTFDSFLAAARQKHGAVYEYPDQPFENSRTRIRIVCPEHGEFTQLSYSHLAGKRCPTCSYEANGRNAQLGLSEFMARAQTVHGDTYTYLSGLSGMHRNMRIQCPVHGAFKQTPANHLKGAGCPRCVRHISKGEDELVAFLRSLGEVVEQSVRTVLAPYEVDAYLPAHRVGVEYNGLWFHRDALVGDKTRRKWEAAEAAGITLVQIFEDEWREQRGIVEARLRALLGHAPKLSARKCGVLHVDAAAVREFLTAHHLQGAGTTLRYAYGLKHDGQLVAVATFGKGRYGNEGWELLRFCSVGRVVGGISRLVAAFARDHSPTHLISYADLRWGRGMGYAAAGFSLDSVTPPDYWWADPKTARRISRYALQSHKLSMPEADFAAAQGYVRVSGVGHRKWVFHF